MTERSTVFKDKLNFGFSNERISFANEENRFFFLNNELRLASTCVAVLRSKYSHSEN